MVDPRAGAAGRAGPQLQRSNLDPQDSFSSSDNRFCNHGCLTEHLDERFPVSPGAPTVLQRHVSADFWPLAGNGNYRSQEQSCFPLVHFPNWVWATNTFSNDSNRQRLNRQNQTDLLAPGSTRPRDLCQTTNTDSSSECGHFMTTACSRSFHVWNAEEAFCSLYLVPTSSCSWLWLNTNAGKCDKSD